MIINNMRYSVTTGGFYDSGIDYPNLPKDAEQISAAHYALLMAAQVSGKRIVADGNGAPIAIDQPTQTPEELRATMALSFAQLLIGLVAEGWITNAEGEAWLAGTLPSAVLGLVATLPSGQQFAAKARAARPSTVLRSDPLVAGLGLATGKTATDLDAFFLTYAQA